MQDPRGDPDPSRLPDAYSHLLRHTGPYYSRIYKALCIDALCFSRKSPGPRRGDVLQQNISSVYSPPRIQDGVWMKLTVHPRLPSLSLSLSLSIFPSNSASFFSLSARVLARQEHAAVGRR